MLLSSQDILDGLRDLAERLDRDGIEVSIFVVGGAAIALTVRLDRDLTRDVDSWVNDHGDPELHAKVFEAVHAVGQARPNFPHDWLNEGPKLYIPDSVSSDPADWIPLMAVGGVRIFVARPDVLLAMKLLAGRGRRDLPDLPSLVKACGITRRQQAVDVFERFYPHDAIKAPAVRWLEANLP